METGNSAALIMEDYLKLAILEDAALWSKVSPSARQLKVLTAYANKLTQASGV